MKIAAADFVLFVFRGARQQISIAANPPDRQGAGQIMHGFANFRYNGADGRSSKAWAGKDPATVDFP